MKLELQRIPGITEQEETEWKIRALVINERSPALAALDKWEREEKSDFKKILGAMKMAIRQRRVTDEKKVKKCANPDYKGTYEFRAHRGHARLMFFYDESDDQIIICTNDYFGKGKSSKKQDSAFKTCHELRNIYFKNK